MRYRERDAKSQPEFPESPYRQNPRNRNALRKGTLSITCLGLGDRYGRLELRHALNAFRPNTKGEVGPLVGGSHLPSGPRDPQGIAQAIWDEMVGESLGTRPADKLVTVAA